jgi:hypothetical protein
MIAVLLFVCLLFVCSSLFARTVSKTLFKIERNKNANIVVYDVKLNSTGDICRYDPIDSYWILNEKNGKRKEVSALEKKLMDIL